MNKALDIEWLRSLVCIADSGSFARAADQQHRSQAAISQQMQRLEAVTDTALFSRQGRKRVLTAQGELLLGHARQLLAAHDRALVALTDSSAEGELRLGAAQGLADQLLPPVLAAIQAEHPRLRIHTRVAPSNRLIEQFQRQQLDLALTVAIGEHHPRGELLARQALVWLLPESWPSPLPDPLPLALFSAPCGYRDCAIRLLERAGLHWREAFQSESLSALQSAVASGLAMTLRTRGARLAGMREAISADGLPALPEASLYLHQHPQSAVAARIAERLRQAELLPR